MSLLTGTVNDSPWVVHIPAKNHWNSWLLLLGLPSLPDSPCVTIRNAAYFSKFVRHGLTTVSNIPGFLLFQDVSSAIMCYPSLHAPYPFFCIVVVQPYTYMHTMFKVFGATRWVNSNITYLYISQNTFFSSSRTSNEQNATRLHDSLYAYHLRHGSKANK